MRLRCLMTCICLLALVACVDPAVTDSWAEAASAHSIVGTISFYEDAATVDIVAALVAGKGWLRSEDAVGPLHEGDRLSLYALEQGLLGEVVLTSEGELASEEHAGDGEKWGLSYRARLQIAREKRDEYEAATRLRKTDSDWWWVDLVAASARDSQAARWVKATPLPGARAQGSRHYAAVSEWLRARGTTEAAIEGMQIVQAVKADVDGNGQDEVFLSVRWRWAWAYTEDGRSNPEHFSYLLMRRLRPGTSTVDTLILDDSAWRSLWVCGVLDLDGDGWAEVITRGQGLDYCGAELFHWDGKIFVKVSGWAAGA